jgi:hypothetical protein
VIEGHFPMSTRITECKLTVFLKEHLQRSLSGAGRTFCIRQELGSLVDRYPARFMCVRFTGHFLGYEVAHFSLLQVAQVVICNISGTTVTRKRTRAFLRTRMLLRPLDSLELETISSAFSAKAHYRQFSANTNAQFPRDSSVVP